ncbi:MAG: DMT family transporter [Bacteroidales bacterium]|nr:DMT family transporter [Bacteroidales bacterium]
MIYLILCILSSTGIFLVFKFIDKKNLPSFPVILINYLVASALGFMINRDPEQFAVVLNAPWIPLSILIGFLFIVMFFLVARSSAEAGISITTVAGKMSVVFPIAFSIVIDPSDSLTFIKAAGIAATLTGVMLTIYQPGNMISSRSRIYIPILLFVGMGLVDSLVKFAQHKYISNNESALFSAVLFTMAFLTGMVILPFTKKRFSNFKKAPIWFWGVILGIVNFGSIYLMLFALNHVDEFGAGIDSSVIFGANNIGIVSLSVLSGLVIFHEKLRPVNWTGIVISLIAILLFTVS